MNQLQRPLVLCLIAFLAGLLPALRFDLSAPPFVLALCGFALIVGLAGGDRLLPAGRHRNDAPGHLPGRRAAAAPRATAAGPLLLIGAAGSIAGVLARESAVTDCRALLPEGPITEVTGLLGAAHRAGGALAGSPLLPLLDARLDVGPGCAGDVRVRLPPDHPDLSAGTPVVLRGEWRRFAAPPGGVGGWPRDPRFQGFLLADSVVVDRSAGSGGSIALRLRAAADARFADLFPRHLPVVEALVLGRREYMDREMRDRFARAGLSHLLAISGMHVGLLAGALLLCGSVLRLSRRRSIALTLASTWVYLLVIGASASALRAGVMVTLALVGLVLQRPAAPLALVSAAALLILGLRPLAILDPGFQLSFAGVIGILLFRRPMLGALPRRFVTRGWLRAPTEAFIVGLAAFVATAPIVAHHFQIVAPISILAGLPAVPVMGVALIGAASALAAAPAFPGIAGLLADGAGLALDVLDWIATAAAAIPYGNGLVGTPPWGMWIAAAGIGTFAARRLTPGRVLVRRAVGTGVATFTLFVWPVLPAVLSGDLQVHFIDVGQGDAIAIRTPRDRWLLVDAGPSSTTFDAGARQIVPFLRARGVRRLEALILTHPDLDHIGGAPAVLAALPVANVFEPGLSVGKASYVDVLGALLERDSRWLAARTGRVLEIDGVRLDILWPDSETVDANVDANEISAIVLLTFGQFSMLLTGDAGVGIEETLVRRHGSRLDVDVLKLGHHGSATSTSELLLEATRPELAVVSAGRRNRYGHPARDVVDRVAGRGIPIARTDREGTITIVVRRGGEAWSRREW